MSINFESVTATNFLPNKCHILRKNTEQIIIRTSGESKQGIYVCNIAPSNGKYIVEINMSCVGQYFYWHGTYNNYTKVDLNTGNNKFPIILKNQNIPFNIGIFSENTLLGKKLINISINITKDLTEINNIIDQSKIENNKEEVIKLDNDLIFNVNNDKIVNTNDLIFNNEPKYIVSDEKMNIDILETLNLDSEKMPTTEPCESLLVDLNPDTFIHVPFPKNLLLAKIPFIEPSRTNPYNTNNISELNKHIKNTDVKNTHILDLLLDDYIKVYGNISIQTKEEIKPVVAKEKPIVISNDTKTPIKENPKPILTKKITKMIPPTKKTRPQPSSNSNEILVSVILPTLNRYESFMSVVKDFINQDLKNFELIAIDDGSHKKIFIQKKIFIDKLKDCRFKFLKNDNNIGVANTLNRGIDNAIGKYITWVSDDNKYYKNYLSVLYDEKYDFTYAYYDIFNKVNNSKLKISYEYNNVSDVVNNFKGLAAFMWKKTLMDKIGKYNEQMFGCEDYDYLIRTFMNTDKIALKKVYIMEYIYHKDCVTHTESNHIMSIKEKIRKMYRDKLNST